MTTLEGVACDAGRARMPLVVAAVLVLSVSAAIPWADASLIVIPGLVSASVATLLGCNVLTAVLLIGRFRGGASPRLVVLAAGFSWSAVMLVGFALARPGVVSATPVIDDRDVMWWLWVSRHIVPTLLITGGLVPWPTSWRFGPDLHHDAGGRVLEDQRRHRRLERRLLSATLLVAVVVVLVAVLDAAAFPSVTVAAASPGVGSRLTPGTAAAVVLVNALAVAAATAGVVMRRSRSVLEAWAVVALVACTGDALLTVLSPSADTVGYFAARAMAQAAAVVVLLFILRDVFALQSRAAQDAIRLERQNGALRDAARLRDRLVAVVSHEMRTPLAGLQAYLELLAAEDDLDDATESRMLERSWLLTRRLTLLSEDLLAVAAIEHGDFVVIPETVNLAHQLDECAACFPEMDLRLVCPSDLMVYADTLRLQQVLNNLIRNAQKHGAEPVTVTATGDEENVVIRVADSGPGVPRDFVHRMFERYSQGANHRAGGSGLGLSVVRDLVRAHRGSVRYDLTCPAFVVTLPHRVEPHPQVSPEPRIMASHGPPHPVVDTLEAPTSALEAFTRLSAATQDAQPMENDLSLTAKK